MDTSSNLKLGIDSAGAKSSLTELRTALAGVKSDLRDLSADKALNSGGMLRGVSEILKEVRKLNTMFDDMTNHASRAFKAGGKGAKEFDNNLKELVKHFIQTGEGAEELTEKVYGLEKGVLASARSMGKLKSEGKMAQDGLQKSLQNTVKDTELLAAATDKLTMKMRQAAAAKQALSATPEGQLKEMQAAVAQRQQQDRFRSASRASQLRSLGVGGAPTSLVPHKEEMNTYISQAQRARQVTQAHAASMREGHSAARGLAGGFHAMWLTWGSLAPLLAGYALSTSIRGAVEGFADVQYQMTFVKALTEDTTHSIESMGARMHRTATELGIRAEDAAEGMRVLAQAGLDTEQSFRALPTMFKLALVGETDLANAALAATGIMNAFGMEVGQLATISDTLVKAGSLSATSVDKMMESMRYAAPTAKQFNVSLEETATILTALAKSNITGSAAGTSAKNMIKELASPTSDAVRELQKILNFSSYDKSGGIKPIFDQIQELRGKLKEFDRETQNNILVKMFGERGDKAFFSIANMARDEFEKIKEGINDAAGFTSGVFFKLQGTVKGQWQLMVADISNTFSEIGGSAESEMVRVMSDLRATFNDPKVKEGLVGLIQSVGTLAELIVRHGPSVLAFFAIWGTSSVIATTLLTAGAALARIGGVIQFIATGAAIATPAVAGLGTATAGAAAAASMVIPPWLRLISLVLSAAAAYALLKQRKDDLITSSTKEVSGVASVAQRMKEENDRTERELELRSKGMNPANANAQIEKDKVTKAMGNLRSEKDRLTQEIIALESGRPVSGESFQTEGATRAAKLENARKKLAATNETLAKTEGSLLDIDKEVERSNKNAKTQKELDKADIARQKAEFEKQNPAGTRTLDMSKLGRTDMSGARMAKMDQGAILEEYRTAERIARDHYKTEVKLANDMYAAKLLNSQQYLELIDNQQAEYLSKREQAERTAKSDIKGMGLPAKQAAELEKQFGYDLKKIENQQKIVDLQDAENERLRVRQETIKSMGEDKKYTTQTLPQQGAEATRQMAIERENMLLSALEGEELAVAQAKQASRMEYEKDAIALQREIDMLNERIRQARELRELGVGAVGQERFDQAGLVLDESTKSRDSKSGALEANRKASAEAQKQAESAAKAVAQQNKWNTALNKSVEIAGKLSATFGKTGGAIGGMLVSYTRFGKAQEDIAKRLEARKNDAGDDPVKLKKAETEAAKESAEAQVTMYGDIAGAAKGFFDEGTTGYKAMEAAERTFRAFELAQAVSNMAVKLGLMETDLVTFLFGQQTKAAAEQVGLANTVTVETAKQGVLGITGVATQAQGDPYSAWARMAAMAATMAALGIAVSGGGGGSPASASDIIAERQKKQNAGTVLGDPDAVSKSIDNSLELLSENSGIGLTHTNAMRFALENIKNNIGNFGRVLAQQGGGIGNPNFAWNGQAFGTEKGSFGFRTTTRDLLGQGISQVPNGWANLGNIMRGANLELSEFQTTREQTTKYWGFGGTETKIRTSFRAASTELEKAVSESLQALAEGMLEAGKGLGVSHDEMMRRINGMSFTLGALDFTGMSAEEAEKAFTDRLSSLGDKMIAGIIPGLDKFQKTGEGLLETAFRMASAIEVARVNLAQFGIDAIQLEQVRRKNTGDLTAELVRDSIMKAESKQVGWRSVTTPNVGGIGPSSFTYQYPLMQLSKIGQIMDKLSGSAEELLEAYQGLLNAQKMLTALNFGDISEALINGAGGIENLQSGLSSLMDDFLEPAVAAQRRMTMLTNELNRMGVSMPQNKESFLALLDGLNQSGPEMAELAGRLIMLAPEIARALEKAPWQVAAEDNLDKQTAIVDELTSHVNTLFNAVKSGKSLLKDIDIALLPEGQNYDNGARIAQLRNQLQANNLTYAQQMEIAGELADLVLEKYQTEKQNAEELLEFAKGMKQYLDDLMVSDLAPRTTAQKLAEAQAQYQTTLGRAQAGDETARGELSGKADAYLRLAQEYFASSGNYQNIFNSVYGQLNALQLNAAQQAQNATAATTAELQQLRGLIAQRTSAAETLYNQQVVALQQALQVQKQIQQSLASLGVLVTLPQQIANMPAEMALQFAHLVPGLSNYNPTTGMPGPGSGTGGGVGGNMPSQPGTYMVWNPHINKYVTDVSGSWQKTTPGTPAYEMWKEYFSGTTYARQTTQGLNQGSTVMPKPTLAYNDGTGLKNMMAGGKDFVGFDQYPATLHYGERVLTNAQARDQDQIAAEVRRLAAIVEQLCEEQREHTTAIVRSNYDANERAAEKIVDGQQKAVDNAAWKDQNEPTIR